VTPPHPGLLPAALGFLQLEPHEPELQVLHRWLDSWDGIELITTGMARQGYRLTLTNLAEGEWRAVFSSHPMLNHDGFAVDPTPWRAVQRAAWEILRSAA
jgi:hypothetical protein